MRKEHHFEVAGRKYVSYAFPATEALELGFELARIATPVLAPLMAAGREQEFTLELADKIAKAVVDHLEPKKAVGLIKKLCSQTTVLKSDEDEPGIKLEGGGFDIHFSGNIENALRVVTEVVQHDFKGFFSGLASLVPGMG